MVQFRVQTALNIRMLEKQTYVRQLDYIRKVGVGGDGHMPEKKKLTLYLGFPSHHPLDAISEDTKSVMKFLKV